MLGRSSPRALHPACLRARRRRRLPLDRAPRVGDLELARHSPELAHSCHSPYPSSESPSGVETNSLNLSSIRLKKPWRLTYARASISPREPWKRARRPVHPVVELVGHAPPVAVFEAARCVVGHAPQAGRRARRGHLGGRCGGLDLLLWHFAVGRRVAIRRVATHGTRVSSARRISLPAQHLGRAARARRRGAARAQSAALAKRFGLMAGMVHPPRRRV